MTARAPLPVGIRLRAVAYRRKGEGRKSPENQIESAGRTYGRLVTESTTRLRDPAPDARRAALRAKVRSRAEDRPGLYRMVDGDGEVLYVGKSIRLRSRLLSYFRASRGEKPGELIAATRSLAWRYVPNEFHAVVHEMRHIKRLRPPYNVEHAGRSRHAFVKLTAGPAPRLRAVRRVARDGGTYFGPFPRPGRLAETLRELSLVLGLPDCPLDTPVHFGDQLEIFADGRTPRCLRADTGSCLAPCAGRCTEREYRGRVRLARRFLEGRSREPLRRLEEGMEAAARRQEYEYAALLRDRLERLDAFRDRLVAFRGRVESLSFVYRVPGFRGDDRLYLIRCGLVVDDVPYPKSRGERSRAAARIEEAFGGPDLDPAELSDAEASEILLVARWFGRRPEERRRTRTPAEWLSRRAPSGGCARTPPSPPAGPTDGSGERGPSRRDRPAP